MKSARARAARAMVMVIRVVGDKEGQAMMGRAMAMATKVVGKQR